MTVYAEHFIMIAALLVALLAATPVKNATPAGWLYARDRWGLGGPEPESPPPGPLLQKGAVNVLLVVDDRSCKPCLTAMEELRATWARYSPDGVRFVVASVQDDAREVRATVERAGVPRSIPVAYGGLLDWADQALGMQDLPLAVVLGRDGAVVSKLERWHPESRALLQAAVSKAAGAHEQSTAGVPDAVRRGRAKLLQKARADDALLPLPAAGEAQQAALARAAAELDRMLAAIDSAVGGLPPAELLRYSLHLRNARDFVRAGPAYAFASADERLSPLSPQSLERRMILWSALTADARAKLFPKLALMKRVTLTLPDAQHAEVVLPHGGFMLDAAPRDVDADAFWAALASGDSRRGWITGQDVMRAWVAGTKGDFSQHVHEDAARTERVRQLSALFQARLLYDERARSLTAGDVLAYSTSFDVVSMLFFVRGSDAAALRVDAETIDLHAPHAAPGEPHRAPFPLSLDAVDKKDRALRPGLCWLRPRAPSPAALKSLMRATEWPKGLKLAPMPAVAPMNLAGPKTAKEAVARLVARAGAGFYWAGIGDDERVALTLWQAPPIPADRFELASTVELIGPHPDSTKDQERWTVVYGDSVITDGNGSVTDALPGMTRRFELEVVRTPDGWKVLTEHAPVNVLLAPFTRLQLELPRTPGAFEGTRGQALFEHRRFAEAAKDLHAAATASTDEHWAMMAARAFARSGVPAEALTWLNTAITRGEPLPAQDDEDFASLRALPGFQALYAPKGR